MLGVQVNNLPDTDTLYVFYGSSTSLNLIFTEMFQKICRKIKRCRKPLGLPTIKLMFFYTFPKAEFKKISGHNKPNDAVFYR